MWKTEDSAARRKEVNIGYFPNLTHMATIVALEKDYFTEEFGEDIKINDENMLVTVVYSWKQWRQKRLM